MKRRITLALLAGLALAACTPSTTFVSTWKSPDAAPLGFRNAKVAAVVMVKNSSTRRAAEDALAKEITKRGAQGVPMYTILEEATAANEDDARSALETAGVKGVIVMRPISKEKEVVAVPDYYGSPYYSGYYGGYYPYGWGGAWGTQVYTDTIVTVETLVYSLAQNKLVWAAESKTTNPDKVDSFVKELMDDVADQLEKEGLIAGS